MTIRTQLASLILIAGAFLPPILHAAQTTPPAPTALDKSIDLSVGDHVKVHTILTQLQQSVASHNASAVAILVHYPIKVNPGKKPFTVKNEKAFIKDYDRIITHDIQDAILKQKYENLFVNSQGAMIGDGEVWITGFCRDKSCKQSDIKIGTIQDTKNLKP
jgi:alpha-beta hydrolase superfamily lysophospholipase